MGCYFSKIKKDTTKNIEKKNHRKLKEKTYYLWYKHTQFVEKVDREMTQSFDGGKVVEGGLIAQWAQYIFFSTKKKILKNLVANKSYKSSIWSAAAVLVHFEKP